MFILKLMLVILPALFLFFAVARVILIYLIERMERWWAFPAYMTAEIGWVVMSIAGVTYVLSLVLPA